MDLRLEPIVFDSNRGDKILSITSFSLDQGKGLKVNFILNGEEMTANYEVNRDFIRRPKWALLIERMERELNELAKGELYLAYRTKDDTFLLLSVSSY